MKRSTLTTILAFVLGISSASQASACLCLPYIPFLDPFAWLGFYGCGGGYNACGCGYGGGGYGGGYGYAPQSQPYGYGGFAPQAMSYPALQQANAGCSDCTGGLAMPQQQAMTAVRVPVTTYRAVTQYVPETTYQTQYRPAPAASVAYQPQQFAYQSAYGYQPAQMAYAAPPVYNPMTSPTTAYNSVVPAQTAYAQPNYSGYPTQAYPTQAYPTQAYSTPSFETPYYTAPTFQPPTIASPGDVGGDHEWSSQSAQIPAIPNSHAGRVPVRPISYGVTPRAARTFSSTVR